MRLFIYCGEPAYELQAVETDLPAGERLVKMPYGYMKRHSPCRFSYSSGAVVWAEKECVVFASFLLSLEYWAGHDGSLIGEYGNYIFVELYKKNTKMYKIKINYYNIL